jgi:hypothetical protein
MNKQTYKKIMRKKIEVSGLQQAFKLKIAPLFAPLLHLLKQT